MFLQDCFLTMSPAWYQSLIKVLLSRFPQSCRHFDDSGVQYLVRRASVQKVKLTRTVSELSSSSLPRLF